MGGGEASCSPKSALSFVAGVVMGTVNTLVMKAMYDMQSEGIDGQTVKFEKPIFMALIMFAAMSLSMPVYWIYNGYIVAEKEREPPISTRVYMLLAIPSAFDLLGSAVSQVGLLYVTPSLFMLVRCTVIIVTAILKVTILKDRLSKHMWLGVGINFLAMCIVSAPSFIGPDAGVGANGRDPRIGIMFIVLSCFIQGSQYVFEEKVMAVDGAPPLVVVGMEGVWGTIMSVAICWPLCYLLPGADKGSLENMWDAWTMLTNNKELQMMAWLFFVSVALYNVFAVFITHLLSSIWHAILDNFRPIAVWATDLFIFYVVTKSFGEEWVASSWLQLAGMFVLFAGTAIYNGSVPFLYWPEDEDLLGAGVPRTPGGSLIHTPGNMSSPYLMRSPLMQRGSRKQSKLRASVQGDGHRYGSVDTRDWNY